jgi:hypothetical protein
LHAFAVDPDLAPVAQPGAILIPGSNHDLLASAPRAPSRRLPKPVPRTKW